MTHSFIASLGRTAAIIEALVCAIDDVQAHWRPAPGKWSIVEVLCHLADEEREDFRTRLELTLRDPDAPWPPIDPEGAVISRDYDGRDLASSLRSFIEERTTSLAWLRTLGDIDLDATHVHPSLGALRAGDLLTSWTAHDLLHIRQLTSILIAYTSAHAHPYSTAYADS